MNFRLPPLKLKLIIAALCAMTFSGTLLAHHSYAPYDIRTTIEVMGVAEEFVYRRPHPILTLIDAENVEWEIEVPIMFWERAGHAQDSIKPGDEVLVRGWPARNGSSEMAMGGFTIAGTYYHIMDSVGQRSGNEAADRIENGEDLEEVLQDYPEPDENAERAPRGG